MRSKAKNANSTVVKCTHCFKSVSVPSRMTIYNFLKNNPAATVGDLVEQVGLTQPTVSYHLKEMKHSGLLKSNRKGKEVFYSINETCPYHDQECIMFGLEFPKA